MFNIIQLRQLSKEDLFRRAYMTPDTSMSSVTISLEPQLCGDDVDICSVYLFLIEGLELGLALNI